MIADLQFDIRDDVIVANLTGEVDSSNAAQLLDAIAEATSNTALGVVLRLDAVDYLDSAGIHLLYRLRESLRARGQKLMLVIPERSPVQDALRMAGVTSHLPIAPSVEEALAGLGREPASATVDGKARSDRDPPQGEPAV